MEKAAVELMITSMEVATSRIAILSARKSIEDYGRRLRGLTRGLWNGTLDRATFEDNVFRAMRRQFTLAWNEGARSQGVTQSERTPEEEEKLQQMINEQAQYIPGLADYVLAHSKQPPATVTTPIDPIVPEPTPIVPEEALPDPADEPRVFSDVMDPKVFEPDTSDVIMMNEWGGENLPTISTLDEEAKNVLVDYQDVRYKEINHSLRNLAPNEMGEGILEDIEVIDKSLRPLNKELTVYRGATNIPEGMFTPGTEFIDDAFSSTSMDQLVGAGFADQKTPGTRAIFQIDLPPEARGIFMGEGATGAALTEAEVLLERGIRFRVGEVVGQYDGDYGLIDIIRLEVVGSG